MISFEIASWEVGEKIEQTNIHTYKQTKMTEGQLRGFIYRYTANISAVTFLVFRRVPIQAVLQL